MNNDQIMMLGLGLQSPWKLVNQHLDTDKSPNELHLHVKADRGSLYPCPVCQDQCKAHDFKEMTWRHINFFQHHAYITAAVPRVNCPEHGIKRIEVPWARKGSRFTLLFEQAAMTLVREMPVNAAARIMKVTDKRLWRIVFHYIEESLKEFDLSGLSGVALDETACKRGHHYVTIFIDMERAEKPVLFVTPGKGKKTIEAFTGFMKEHKAQPEQVLEVVCDMSAAFLSGVGEYLPNAQITVDWFHVVKLFTTALDDVRKSEGKEHKMPKHLRWAVLKRAESDHLTANQLFALAELQERGLDTAIAWKIKEKLCWFRKAKSARAAKWRLTRFINYAREMIGDTERLEPVRTALSTLEDNAQRILQRWHSNYTNARLEGMNGLFQAARSRARGYRNTETFAAMIYLIGSPAGYILEST